MGAKLITVPQNGQISIGTSWAGRQIRVEEVNDNEIHIVSGTFVPDSQKTFYTQEAKQSLTEFDDWERHHQARATDTSNLFQKLKKKKRVSGE